MPTQRPGRTNLVLPPPLEKYDAENERQTRRAIEGVVTQLSTDLGVTLPWIEVTARGANSTADIQGAIDQMVAVVPTGAGETSGGGIVLLTSPHYVADGLVLKYGVHVIGLGQQATKITAPTGSSATAVWLLNTGIVAYASIRGMTIIGAGNAGQHGMYFRAVETLQAGATQGGLWNSCFSDLKVEGFTGEGIWFHAGGDNFLAPHQFINLDQIEVECPSTTTRCLRMSGECNQFKFIGPCRFEGPGQASGGTCVLLERTVNAAGVNNGDLSPDIIGMDLVSFQSNTRGMTIERAQNVSVTLCHFESLSEGILVDVSARNVVIERNDFANVGHVPTLLTGFGVKVAGGEAIVANNSFSWSSAPLAPDTHYIRTGGHLQIQGRHLDDTGIRTTGATLQINASATLDVTGFNTVYVNTSATAITTITSSLPPGEFLTLKAHNGTIVLQSGGNLYFDSGFQWASPLTVVQDSCIVLQRFDLEEQWHMVAGIPNGTSAGAGASTADSKAVSSGLRASTADSKALSAATQASTASTAAATADSKAVSSGTRASTADSKALSDSVVISNHESRLVSHGI